MQKRAYIVLSELSVTHSNYLELLTSSITVLEPFICFMLIYNKFVILLDNYIIRKDTLVFWMTKINYFVHAKLEIQPMSTGVSIKRVERVIHFIILFFCLE